MEFGSDVVRRKNIVALVTVILTISEISTLKTILIIFHLVILTSMQRLI